MKVLQNLFKPSPKRTHSEIQQQLVIAFKFTEADLVIDGTERRRQRPKAKPKQTDHYSGKKKTHTDKHIVVVNRQTKKVAYCLQSDLAKPMIRK